MPAPQEIPLEPHLKPAQQTAPPTSALIPPISSAPAAAALAEEFREGGQQVQVVRLTADSGATAEILPGISGTVRSFKAGGEKELLVYPPGEYTFARGIPAPFFFFGGRIVGGKFKWKGQGKDLTPYLDDKRIRKDADGNALHGLQFPWEVDSSAVVQDSQTGRQGATTTLTYDASKNRIFREVFDQGDKHASAKLKLTYTIIGDDFAIEYSIKNDGQVDIPNYTNIHPWINTDGKPVAVSLPASERIIYENHVRVGQEPATGEYDFRTEPKKIDGAYEEVFKARGDGENKAVSTLILPDKTEVEVTQDVREFPYVKVWVNPKLNVASIQPLSDNIGSFTQAAEPTCDIIPPNEERKWAVKMKVKRPKPEMLAP